MDEAQTIFGVSKTTIDLESFSTLSKAEKNEALINRRLTDSLSYLSLIDIIVSDLGDRKTTTHDINELIDIDGEIGAYRAQASSIWTTFTQVLENNHGTDEARKIAEIVATEPTLQETLRRLNIRRM